MKQGRDCTPATGTRLLLLLLVLCLAECVTEQRINRGSKATNNVQKVNSYRSQRGGSCLSYGHSCWGAHGKRSMKQPSMVPDRYIARMLRRMTVAEADRTVPRPELSDISAIFNGAAYDDPTNNRPLMDNEDVPMEMTMNRFPDAKPMLDDELLNKFRLWRALRQQSTANLE